MRSAVAAPIAAGGVVVTAVLAHRGLGPREAACFRCVNRVPEWLHPPAWLVMQAGSLGASVAAGAIAGHRHGTRHGAVVTAVGAGTWALVKAVKPVVGRARPIDLVDGAHVHGTPATGLGYPSGHAAVSAALAAVGPVAPGALVSGVVGVSRMYVGAHLPLDVVGGWSIGLLTGLAGRAALERVSPGRPALARGGRRRRPASR